MWYKYSYWGTFHNKKKVKHWSVYLLGGVETTEFDGANVKNLFYVTFLFMNRFLQFACLGRGLKGPEVL